MGEKYREKQFLLLQINDALFPIGGYSHSYGLETYIQKNLITSVEDAWHFLYRRVRYGFCYNECLSARLAYQYAAAGQEKELERLEDILEASRIPREIREAGQKMGSRFVKTVMRMGVPFESDIFSRYLEARQQKGTTHSIVYGVFCAAAGIPLEDALEHYLYAQTSLLVTNCVKTVPLSQTDGQTLLYRCQALFRETLEAMDDLTEDDLCLSTPGFDVRSMQHEALYSRIFMS